MKVAFVVPWYGEGIMGGAETLAKTTAENLRRRGIEVEILTTCSKQFMSDWTNDYEEGLYDVDEVPVRRFRVDPRNTKLFDKINLRLMNSLPISPDDEGHFIKNMINSSTLNKFIARHASQYVFFFIPYMFGTTYFGSQICPERSFLIPCLHDESYAYLHIFRQMFEAVRGVLFLSEPEMELAMSLYSLDKERCWVVGAGIDTEINSNEFRFRRKFGVDEDFILYVGRKDSTKNTPLLIDFFSRYIELGHKKLKLVLNGPGNVSVPDRCRKNIIDLTPVSGQEKYDGFAAAVATCQPSIHESFSIIIMESWVCGTPVLVHGNCAVTKYHCTRSNGGLYFQDFDEFAACVDFLIENTDARRRMGENGREYVRENFAWEKVMQKYLWILHSFINGLGPFNMTRRTTLSITKNID